MKRLLTLVFVILLACIGTTFAGGGAHWGYSGHEGPEHWGELDKSYEMCGMGKNQSPIDLTGFIEADLAPLAMDYASDSTEILNNGHAVQVNYEGGSTLTVGDRTFELKQYHFHAPSENTIDGKSFAMEGHLVHADKDGNLAVVAVMYDEGSANETMEKLWSKMPENKGDKHALAKGISVNGVLPKDRDYYRFNGSLTTPPCSEGVMWFVMKAPVAVSKEQVKEFEHVMHHPNNRPVQPVNARMVLK